VFVSFCTVVTEDSKIGISCCRCLVSPRDYVFYLFLKNCLSIVNCLLNLGAIVITLLLLFAEYFGRIIDNWKPHLGMLTTYSYFKNFQKPILVMKIHWSWFGRTTLDFISCSWHLFSPFPSKEAWNCVFLDLFFRSLFLNTIQIFNSFSTDLYLIFCQLNLNSIVELYWIGFQFNAIVHENSIPFFHWLIITGSV